MNVGTHRRTSATRALATVTAALVLCIGIVGGGGLLLISKLDMPEFRFDLGNLGPAIVCDAWERANAEPDPVAAEARRAEALRLFADLAHGDPALAEALWSGPQAIDAWCVHH